MMKKLGVGIIGCGNVSAHYMRYGSMFNGVEVIACADINPEAAKARAEEFNLRADSIEDLLAADDIDIIINLTIPAAHLEVSQSILNAGKHVYSEKPYVLSTEEGDTLKALAAEKGLRIGSAPDTFLGGSHQQARRLIDTGTIGKVTSGTAIIMGHGMEHWHPNPDFFYQPGAGPVLDIGPYYISNLVQLLGPVERISAMTSTPSKTRTISNGPRNGETIPVDTPTTIHALLQFKSGAIITVICSWDVWNHDHNHMELYGEDGTMYLPDPNFFAGDLKITSGSEAVDLPSWEHPFTVPNFKNDNAGGEMLANYRGAGLSDMSLAIQEGRGHRCSMEFAHHVVDIMTSILTAGETNQTVELTTTCERPEVLDAAAAQNLLA
ncbi:MAG: Gfo/Idh/MocA family oxidoreductase [Lentilitoribacter sp.]